MGREPQPQQRAVALAGVDMNVLIRVFTVAMDDVLAVEGVVEADRTLEIRRYRRLATPARGCRGGVAQSIIEILTETLACFLGFFLPFLFVIFVGVELGLRRFIINSVPICIGIRIARRCVCHTLRPIS